jgi:uncharacterized protein with beta-barrel porin domain
MAPKQAGVVVAPQYNIWTSGGMTFGKKTLPYGVVDNTASKGNISMPGVVAGIDTKISPNLKVGISVGLSSDRNNLDFDGTQSQYRAATATAYASWKIRGSIFVDGVLGYSDIKFKSTRYDSNASGLLSGSRSANSLFGSLAISDEHTSGSFKFAPYLRVDVVKTQLNAYSETGDPDWAMSYMKTAILSQSSVVGVRGQYDIDMSWATVSPTVRVEYRHIFNGQVAQSMAYVSSPSTSYQMSINPNAKDSITTGLGLKIFDKGNISGRLEYLLTTAGNKIQSQGFRADVNGKF